MPHHLRSLVHQPDEQVQYALGILERERGKQVVSEALNVLIQRSIPQARPILLRLYAYYDEAGVKRDAGGDLRTALLGALLSIVAFYRTPISIGTGIPTPQYETRDDVVLLGFFDRMLAWPTNAVCLSFLEAFVRKTQRSVLLPACDV